MSGLLRMAGFALLAMVAGSSFVTQSAVNAKMRSETHATLWAAFISYLGGTVIMAVLLAANRHYWPHADAIARSSWISWAGGLFGVVYVVLLIMLLPRLGTGTVVALFVAGQMFTSLAFDHFGAFGTPRQPVDLSRVLGAALLVAGVVLIRR